MLTVESRWQIYGIRSTILLTFLCLKIFILEKINYLAVNWLLLKIRFMRKIEHIFHTQQDLSTLHQKEKRKGKKKRKRKNITDLFSFPLFGFS